jgi:ABC-2 type transport system ATP-binding protein
VIGPGAAADGVPRGDPVVHTQGLERRYGAVTAVADLSLTVQAGEVFGFLGPNGSGKTTSVKLLLGLVRPTGGDGMVLGAPLGDLSARRRIGYLPELFRYPDWLTGREVATLHARLAGLEPAHRAEAVAEALRRVGLAERADHRVATYSKGMQQRLGLAVALLGQPALVFLDEPTSALDPVGRHDVREVIRHLRDRGCAVFLNSHLLSEVEQVCDRVAMVRRGRVVAQGPLREVLGGAVLELEVEGLSDLASLARFGAVRRAGSRIEVTGVARDGVPDLVGEVVRLGGRVFAVSWRHVSLEERFIAWLGEDGA